MDTREVEVDSKTISEGEPEFIDEDVCSDSRYGGYTCLIPREITKCQGNAAEEAGRPKFYARSAFEWDLGVTLLALLV